MAGADLDDARDLLGARGEDHRVGKVALARGAECIEAVRGEICRPGQHLGAPDHGGEIAEQTLRHGLGMLVDGGGRVALPVVRTPEHRRVYSNGDE